MCRDQFREFVCGYCGLKGCGTLRGSQLQSFYRGLGPVLLGTV